jgi:DeoR family suf operon transcriptional repressor
MSNSREKILKILLTNPGSTINELAEAVGINSISIRHHLINLEEDNLVTSEEERHGVGRPRLTYRLTEKGVDEFPSNYHGLTRRLLDFLRKNNDREAVEKIFEMIGEELAETYQHDMGQKTLEEKVRLVRDILIKEGFLVEIQKDKDSYMLKSLSCPYYRLRKEYPEICALDHTLISRLFSKPVEVHSCIFEGDDHCIYQIQTDPKVK